MSAWKRFAHGKAIPESDVEAERIRDPVSASLLTAAIAFRLGNLEVAKSTILKVPFPIVRDKMRARYAALVTGIRAVLRSKNGHPLVARDVVPIRVNETRRRERELAMAIRRFPVVPPWLITLRKMRVERAQPIITIADTVQAALPSNIKNVPIKTAAHRSIISTVASNVLGSVRSLPGRIANILPVSKPTYITQNGLDALIEVIYNYPMSKAFHLSKYITVQKSKFKISSSVQLNIVPKEKPDHSITKHVWAPKNLRNTDFNTMIKPTVTSFAVADYGFIYESHDNDWNDDPQGIIDYKCRGPIYMFLNKLEAADKIHQNSCFRADDVLQFIRNSCITASITTLIYTGNNLVPDMYSSANKEHVAAHFKSNIDIVNRELLEECERTTFKSEFFNLTITRGYGKKGTTVVDTSDNNLKHTIEQKLLLL